MIKSSKRWDFDEYISEINQQKNIGPCKKCGSPVVERKDFYGCSAFKSTGCNFTLKKVYCGKKIPIKDIRRFLEKGSTSLIKGFQNQKQETFDAYIVWDTVKGRAVFSKKGYKEGDQS